MSTTAPVTWTTWPSPASADGSDLVATAMGVSTASLSRARQLLLAGLCARRDFDHFTGDVGLANLVVAECQIVDQVFGVFRGVLHCHHPARLLACLCLKHRL